MEIMMAEHHPLREHIRRVLDSEEARAQEDARALLRTQQLTGAQTTLNCSWPPEDNFRVYFGEPRREMFEEEDGFDDPGSDTTDYESDTPATPPPPYCGPDRFKENPDQGPDRDGNGRPAGIRAL